MNDIRLYAFVSLFLLACSSEEAATAPTIPSDADAETGTRPDGGGGGREAATSDGGIATTADDPTSTNVTGGVKGHLLVPADTRAFLATDSVNGRSAPSATIYVADYAPFCNGGLKAHGTFLRLHVSTEQAAVHLGTYPVTGFGNAPGTDQASSDFASMDGACKPVFPTANGASGTIEVTSVSASEIRGRFDVTYETGDSVKGTFVAATACSAVPSEDVCIP